MSFPILPLNYSYRYGTIGMVIEKQGDLVTDLYGLSTCQMTGKCAWNHPEYIPNMFDQHPLYRFTNLERRSLSLIQGFYVFVGDYAGVDGTPAHIYELSAGLGEEPIETHPNFRLKIGGYPSQPLNGAWFIDPQTGELTTDDSIGVFDHFVTNLAGQLNPFAGISSYLDMSQAIWRERYVSSAPPTDTTILGQISTPPGPIPPLGDIGGATQNWLYQGCTYEQRGICFTVTKEWRASGFRGWNQAIYTP